MSTQSNRGLVREAYERDSCGFGLIASLDDMVEDGAEAEWHEVIDRRSREIEEGKVVCQPVEQTIQNLRHELHARRQPS